MVNFSLDAGAVICWLKGEAGAGRVAEVVANPANVIRIHIVNLIEVRYHYLRRGREALAEVNLLIADWALEIDREISEPMAAMAAEIKANFAPVSLADTIAVAHAATTGAVLLTTDRGEMEKLTRICQIEFLR